MTDLSFDDLIRAAASLDVGCAAALFIETSIMLLVPVILIGAWFAA